MDQTDSRLNQRKVTESQHDSGLTDKIWREIRLLGHGVAGIGSAAENALDHPLETGGKLAASATMGVGLGFLCRRAGVIGLAGRAIGASMGLAFLSDIGHHSSSMARALSDTWTSGNNWDKNVVLMRDSMGTFTFDTALMSAGAMSGGLLGRRIFQGRAADAATYSSLIRELKCRGFNEQHIVGAARPENVLGIGGNATVYRIPMLDGFAVRVPHRFGTAKPGLVLEPVPDILPGVNIGQPVARLGDWTILKRQSGVPAGGPLYSERKKMGDEAANHVYFERVKAASEMPQSAYDDLAATLKLLNERGLNFDPSKPGNILIDVPGKRFNVVDINPAKPGSTYRHSVSDMVITLMDNGSAWRVPKSAALQSHYRSIVEKSFKAARAKGLPTDNGGSSLEYSLQLAGLMPG